MTNYEATKERKRMENMGNVDVHDLCRACLVELKQNYLTELAENGEYSEVMETEYDEPSISDYAEADTIIPDDVIFEHYDGINFTADDFFCLYSY